MECWIPSSPGTSTSPSPRLLSIWKPMLELHFCLAGFITYESRFTLSSFYLQFECKFSSQYCLIYSYNKEEKAQPTRNVIVFDMHGHKNAECDHNDQIQCEPSQNFSIVLGCDLIPRIGKIRIGFVKICFHLERENWWIKQSPSDIAITEAFENGRFTWQGAAVRRGPDSGFRQGNRVQSHPQLDGQ